MIVTWDRTLQRIATDARGFQPTKVLLTILAAPFYLLGLVIGLVWFVLIMVWASVAVGVDVGRRVRPQRDEE